MNHCAVLLDRPSTPDNVGTIFRSALALGAQSVILCGPRWPLDRHPLDRLKTDPSCAYRHLDVRVVSTLAEGLSLVPKHAIAAAVVERYRPNHIFLDTFVHPCSCAYVFGPEDGFVALRAVESYWSIEIRGALAWADERQGCLNLAAVVSIVLYDRAAKLMPPAGRR